MKQKVRTKEGHIPTVVRYGKTRKSNVLPDQAFTIKQIMERFVVGAPVNVARRRGVYMDHNNTDYEKLSRLDAVDKLEMSKEFAERAVEIDNEFAEAKRRSEEQREERRKKAEEARRRKTAAKDSSIDPLDNTMLDDTESDSQ